MPSVRPVLFLICFSATACGHRDVELSCSIEEDSAIRNVMHVQFTTEDPGTAEVTFQVEGEDPFTATGESGAASGDGLRWDLPLYGLPADSAGTYSVEVTLEDGRSATCEGSFETGPLPSDMDAVSLVLGGGEGPTFIAGVTWNLIESQLFVSDREGRTVWYHDVEGEVVAVEMFPHPTRSDAFLYNVFDLDRTGELSEIRTVTFGGEELDPIPATGCHHVFTVLPPEANGGVPGGLAWLAMDVRPWTDPSTGVVEDLVGDKLVERSPDGVETVLWSAWDNLNPVRTKRWDLPFYPNRLDWTHGNSLQYIPATDHYLFSLDNVGAIIELDRASGQTVRAFSAGEVDIPGAWQVRPGDQIFVHAHDVRLTDQGQIRLFSTDEETDSAGALYYTLDAPSEQLVEADRLGYDQGYQARFLGQVYPLDNGDTLINFASAGQLAQLNEAEELQWGISTDLGVFFAQVHPMNSFYAD